jgi:hypothetical protein
MHTTEPSTPTGARVTRAARAGALAATALAGVALMSACGSSSSSTSTSSAGNLNIPQIEASIKGTILEKRHLVATVSCPAVEPKEKGKTFVCVATTPGIKNPHTVVKTPFTVTVQNDKGYVTYAGE